MPAVGLPIRRTRPGWPTTTSLFAEALRQSSSVHLTSHSRSQARVTVGLSGLEEVANHVDGDSADEAS